MDTPNIQNASPGEWKNAIEAGLSYQNNPLRDQVRKYFKGDINRDGYASKELMDFLSFLQKNEVQGNKDQILSNVYSGLADAFPVYIKDPRFNEYRDEELTAVTQIILKAEGQVGNILELQNTIKAEFIKYNSYLQTHDIDFIKKVRDELPTEEMKINSSFYIRKMMNRYLRSILTKTEEKK